MSAAHRPSPAPRSYRPDKAVVGTVITAVGTFCATLGAAWLDGSLTGAEVLFAISTTLGVAGGTGTGVYLRTNREKE